MIDSLRLCVYSSFIEEALFPFAPLEIIILATLHSMRIVDHVSSKLLLYFREGLAFGLDHEEDNEEHAQEAYQSEEEEHRGVTERVDGAWKGYRNRERQHPIEESRAGRCCTLQARRENLAHVGPGNRTWKYSVRFLRSH
ncbi:hypothetical protein X777_05376 [Ooceraea biroi]|uniref:Uncharacterized protein n=1 Tax=Ooceraea biroi TaxID=2015173 RepID=A0A026WG07_OOCBI|nr:hypothetical protein X777_05376 [Ooceraea biroi]